MESEVKVKSLSHVQLFATPWTVAYQAPPSMGFSRQECWSGLPFPSRQTAKAVLKKKSKVGRLKTYYKASLIKIMWQKEGLIDQ